jgi:hypothetical protein
MQTARFRRVAIVASPDFLTSIPRPAMVRAIQAGENPRIGVTGFADGADLADLRPRSAFGWGRTGHRARDQGVRFDKLARLVTPASRVARARRSPQWRGDSS